MSNRPPSRLFVLAERVEAEVIISNYFNPQAIASINVLTKPSGHKNVTIFWLSGHKSELKGEAANSFLKVFEQPSPSN